MVSALRNTFSNRGFNGSPCVEAFVKPGMIKKCYKNVYENGRTVRVLKADF